MKNDDVLRDCPHCGGPVTFEQKVMMVRTGTFALEPDRTPRVRQNGIPFRPNSTNKPTGITKMFCTRDCKGSRFGNSYLGSIPGSRWQS